MEKTKHNSDAVGRRTPPALFSPFDAEGILCVQDGEITAEPDPDRDWIEYHIESEPSGIYLIECCPSEEFCYFVYRGRIPDRAFFEAVMNNQDVPLPESWENSQDRGR